MADQNQTDEIKVEDAVEELTNTLSPEQIADMEDDLLTDEEKAALADDGDDDEEEAETAEVEEAEPTPEPVAASNDPVKPYEVPDDVLMGEALEAKQTELAGNRKSVIDDYDDGELSREEMDERLNEIAQESATLTSEAAKHEALLAQSQEQAEAQAEAAKNAWKTDVEGYFTTHEGLNTPEIKTALNTFVVALDKNEAYAGMSNEDLLTAAHESLYSQAARLKLDVPAPATAKKAPAKQEVDDGQPKKALPASERDDPPTTLRQVPASEQNPADDSRFGAIDRALDSGDPDVIDRAMKSLSADEAAQYARAS